MAISVREYVEVLAAIHCSSYVTGDFVERGGLMIVGPPAVLKSTLLGILDRHYHDALSMSDVNAKTLSQLRDAVAAGRVRTLVFPELAKLYERKAETAANVEGVLRAFAAEGFDSAGFEDSRISRFKARATVIGAMTMGEQQAHFDRWETSGFNRRFIWSLITLANPTVLQRAVIEWKRISFRVRHLPLPPIDGSTIPNLTTRSEREAMRTLCKYQPGGDMTIQMQLLVKALAVLRWSYEETGDQRDPVITMQRFGETMGKHGGVLSLDPPDRNAAKEAREVARVAARTLSKRRQTAKRRKR